MKYGIEAHDLQPRGRNDVLIVVCQLDGIYQQTNLAISVWSLSDPKALTLEVALTRDSPHGGCLASLPFVILAIEGVGNRLLGTWLIVMMFSFMSYTGKNIGESLLMALQPQMMVVDPAGIDITLLAVALPLIMILVGTDLKRHSSLHDLLDKCFGN